MKKVIEGLTHHLDDYECMWNGIEDMYMTKTKEKLPDQFFFAMSGFFGNVIYLKDINPMMKRMVSFGEGRTSKLYEFLAPIVGFEYQFIESQTPEEALQKAKSEIDQNHPVVIGAIDMYYLDYMPKIYLKVHIPIHYFMMIGYDDEEKVIYIHDCGRKEIIKYSYDLLFKAWNASYPGLCNPNTIITIRFKEELRSMKEIFIKSMEIKANSFMNPPMPFLGVSAFKSLASEISGWEKELGKEETKKLISNIVEFCGTVPKTPNVLLGIPEKDTFTYKASRDKMSKVLFDLGKEYNSEVLNESAKLFVQSGDLFEKMNNKFIDYLLGKEINFTEIQMILLEISNIEYKAYSLISQEIYKI